MDRIKRFFKDIDKRWRGASASKIPLHVIGSAALMLQTDYERGTKDSDIIQTRELTPEIEAQLKEIAGKDSELCKIHRMWLDIVAQGLPFLPQTPNYVEVPKIGFELDNFEIHALEVADVIVSKLKRFNSNDKADIRAMVEAGRVKHARLIERFEKAADAFAMDSRIEDVGKKYLKNLHTVERDLFSVEESQIDLPEWG